MKFDMNRAWQQAIASLGMNRDVLLPIAGVFFILPMLLQAYFTFDIQNAIMANLGNPAVSEKLMEDHSGTIFGVSLIAFIAQVVGYMAMLALLTDADRPTVGAAMVRGIGALPTLVGALVIFALGYFVVAGAFVIVIGLAAAGTVAAGSGAASMGIGMVLAFLGFLAAIAFVMVKLSLTIPVIVIDRVLNPFMALVRSWQLTNGNTLRLFAFYALLAIAYFVLLLLAWILMMGAVASLSNTGTASKLVIGVVFGAVSAVTSALFTAILAAIHRQLAGPSTDAISRTFE